MGLTVAVKRCHARLTKRRVTDWLWGSRYLLLFAWGIPWFLPAFERTSRGLNDWLPFEVGARTLVHWHHMKVWSTPALHLYVTDPQLQIGPPPLLLIAPFERFSPYAVALGFGLVMCAMGVAALAALEACAKTLAPEQRRRLTLAGFLVGIVAIAVWSHEIGLWRHLDDAMALLCISVGLWLCARRGPWWAIALIVGIGVAAKPWAVVAATFILGLPRPQWAKTVLLSMCMAALWWLPFVVAAPGTASSLNAYRTYTQPGSVLALVGLHGNVAGWIRPVQLCVGIGAASYVALRGRWIAAPLVGFAIRLGLDPYTYHYYVLGPLVASFVVDLTSRSRLPRWTIFTLFVEFGGELVADPKVSAIARLVWCAVVVLWFARPRARVQLGEAMYTERRENSGWMGLPIPHLLPQVAVFGCRSNVCHKAERQEKSTPVARRGRKARGLEGPRVSPAASAGASLGGPRSGKLATPACYSSEGSE